MKKIKDNLLRKLRIFKQEKKISRRVRSKKLIVLPANSILNFPTKINTNLSILVTEIKAGKYELIFKHSDENIHKNRKSMWASFDVAGSAKSKYVAEKLGVNFSEQFGPFQYMGGGRYKNGLFVSRSLLSFDYNKDFMLIDLHIPNKKFINLSEIGFINNSSNVKDEIYSENIIRNKLLTIIRSIQNNNTILIYANISPNVVDGSSIWLSSITNILSRQCKVILLVKENVKHDLIISNIDKENVIILQPKDYCNFDCIDESIAANIIRIIDYIHPKLRAVLTRGVNAGYEIINDRVFKYRSIAYLTDFYEVKDDSIFISDEKLSKTKNILLHTSFLLVQTEEIKNTLFNLVGYEHKNFAFLPPSLPNNITNYITEHKAYNPKEINIGYAGKIMPNWGVEELLEWIYEFKNKNSKVKINLHIAANKIWAPGELKKPFINKINELFSKVNVVHYKDFNREQCITLLQKMDYVWAWRPAKFEENTLELSTKLLEGVALKQRVICYPSNIHKNELGVDYPYFILGKEDLFSLLSSTLNSYNLDKLSNDIINKHKINNVSDRIRKYKPLSLLNNDKTDKIIVFSGHDFKFIDAYISELKSQGYNILKDIWNWGNEVDLEETKRLYNISDIIFCEWGLANAVWYSNNNINNKPIYIRVHLQEINDRARKFGYKINFNAIQKVIFVSERVRDEYIKLFDLDISKTVVISNFVMNDEYDIYERNLNFENRPITIGMVGIVPQRKRFDRSVELLKLLNKNGINAELHIKGHRPENLEFMKGASRIKELEYYQDVYKNIDKQGLSNKVKFSNWGNDVALWYQNIDFILSPSDFESFHYALADGILSGAFPIIWNWEEAKKFYINDWIIDDAKQAIDIISDYISSDNKMDILVRNRNFIIKKYGRDNIFNSISSLIFSE